MIDTNYGTHKRTFAPDVMDALVPSAIAMDEVIRAEKMKPRIGDLSESRDYRKAKARCVHRFAVVDPADNNSIIGLERKIVPTEDEDTVRCAHCKAKILKKLDNSAITKLTEALEVIDTIIAFGPDLGLINVDAAHPEEKPIIDSMIDVKQFFALHLIPLTKTMISTTMLEDAYTENDRNFTSEYLDRTKKPTALF